MKMPQVARVCALCVGYRRERSEKSYLEDIEDVRAAEDALSKIESGKDQPMSLAELDEYLSRDLDG